MTSEDADREKHHHWHAIPGMIGEAITTPDYPVHHCGGYFVRRRDDGTISIYRQLDVASTRDALTTDGDHVVTLGSSFVAGAECGYISPPEDGWESETDTIPEFIWEGYR
jgi:hypothetical protein